MPQETFLLRLATDLLKLSVSELSKTVVILPNRRSGVFLKKHLLENTATTTWEPEIFSIEDFAFSIAGLKKAGATDQIFELYESYLHIGEISGKSFEDFGSFGPGLLKDFNEIDNYLADAKIVFRYLHEARTLQKWNPEEGILSKKFLQFYANLEKYYQHFRTKLLEQNTGYYGLAIRKCVESPDMEYIKSHRFFLAGFNALSKAEEELFTLLTQFGDAKTYIDADAYYLDDTNQEAGRHLRKLLKNNKLNFVIVKSEGFKIGKNIKVTGLPGEFAMVKMAGKIVSEIENPNETTALVLPNEDLLFQMISSLPESVEKLNITMSFPFQNTGAYDCLMKAFLVFESALRNRKTEAIGEPVYHYKALVEYMNTGAVNSKFNHITQNFTHELQVENISLLPASELNTIAANHTHEPHFPLKYFILKELKSNLILKNLIELTIDFQSNEHSNTLEAAIFKELQTILEDLLIKIEKYKIQENPSILRKIFQSLCHFKGIPFEGEPLEGVQIMGLLETRALDFENVIYLSFNEGSIPSTVSFKSYILPEIRSHFGLPMPMEEDAVSAYHFYRSIQRAKNVFLLYNTIPEAFGGGEISRFGMQLNYESKDKNVNYIERKVQLPAPVAHRAHEIVNEKDDEVIKKLEQLACSERGLSPSALMTYLTCPLKYYFRYVVGVKPLEEIEEDLADNTRGQIIHKVLETIYLNEKNNKNLFDDNFFDQAERDYKAILKDIYSDIFRKGDTEHGYNLIIKKLDEKYIDNFLKQDRTFSRLIEDVDCEINLKATLNIEANGKPLTINFSGNADRIDRKSGIRRIIDYKSGSVSPNELKINEAGENQDIWERIFEKGTQLKTFQLLMYTLMYFKNHPYEKAIIPVIGALKQREVFAVLQPKSGFVSQEIIMEFEEQLKKLVQKIFDRNEPFRQTEDVKACRNCDYKNVCNR